MITCFINDPMGADMNTLEYLNENGNELAKSMSEDLLKSNRSGLVQVERNVVKRGTSFMQKFWVRPDEVKKTDIVLKDNSKSGGKNGMTQVERTVMSNGKAMKQKFWVKDGDKKADKNGLKQVERNVTTANGQTAKQKMWVKSMKTRKINGM